MADVFGKAEEKMTKTTHVLENDFAAIRAGRANPNVLDKIAVDYYGTPTPIHQLASISVSEARILVIQPWDTTMLHPIEKAIQSSDLGINPQNDGRTLRLIFPQLTEERRKEIVRDVSKKAEESKVALRAVRREAIEHLKKMKKESEITEDDLKDSEHRVQEITDTFVKKIDEIASRKEKEILEI